MLICNQTINLALSLSPVRAKFDKFPSVIGVASVVAHQSGRQCFRDVMKTASEDCGRDREEN
jgi:hypothetical protein